jgi:hypothetical protein
MTPVVLATADEAPWRAWAACRGTDPRYFHGSTSQRSALNLCAACPVRECCFWFALATEEVTEHHYGIWGGTTAAERERFADSLPRGFAGEAHRTAVAAWSRHLPKRAVA